MGVDVGEPGVDFLVREVVEAHVDAGERAHLRDAGAHLDRAGDADGVDLGGHRTRLDSLTLSEQSPAPSRSLTFSCGRTSGHTLAPSLRQLFFEFWQDGEEVADEAVVGPLEDRRLLV